ncbi:MAG: lipid-binding SYLF domain-containing protein [Steroidobacteraceae bacterium]
MPVRAISQALFALLLIVTVPALQAETREDARLITATKVLEELRGLRDQQIPDRLLERAYAVAVIPDVIKVGFGIGGRRGKGVLVVRDGNGHFGQPIFVALTGGSIGWQIGAQATDVVLVFTTRRGVEGITGGKLTLGADASVAAGPVGRQAEAATDVNLAEVYSYSRSRGLFAGVALDGTAITIDRRANGKFYGQRKVEAADILNGSVHKNSETAQRFLHAVSSSTGAAARPVARDSSSSQKSNDDAGESGAKSYPMEDKSPGSDPPQ